MTALALPRPWRLTGFAVALSLVAGALVSFAVSSALLSGGDPIAPASHTARGDAFTLAVPAGWSALSDNVLRSRDGRGVVIVRPTTAARTTGRALTQELTTRLHARFAGFHGVNARLANIRAGRAFVYTFVRDPERTAQTIAFTTVRGRAYEIDAVVRSDSPAAARDAAAIIASFGS
jgi:DcrB